MWSCCIVAKMEYILFLATLSLIQAQSKQQPQGQSPPFLQIAGPLPLPVVQPLPGEIPQGSPKGSIPTAPTGPQIPAQEPVAGRPFPLLQGSLVRAILPQPSSKPHLPIQGQPIDQKISGPRQASSPSPSTDPIPQPQPGPAPPSQDLIAALGLNGVLSKPIPPRLISEQEFSYFLSRVQAQAQLGNGASSRRPPR